MNERRRGMDLRGARGGGERGGGVKTRGNMLFVVVVVDSKHLDEKYISKKMVGVLEKCSRMRDFSLLNTFN